MRVCRGWGVVLKIHLEEGRSFGGNTAFPSKENVAHPVVPSPFSGQRRGPPVGWHPEGDATRLLCSPQAEDRDGALSFYSLAV